MNADAKLTSDSKVVNTQDGEFGIVMNSYSFDGRTWDSYEVETAYGVEVWKRADLLTSRCLVRAGLVAQAGLVARAGPAGLAARAGLAGLAARAGSAGLAARAGLAELAAWHRP
jgi:hypothetical protein